MTASFQNSYQSEYISSFPVCSLKDDFVEGNVFQNNGCRHDVMHKHEEDVVENVGTSYNGEDKDCYQPLKENPADAKCPSNDQMKDMHEVVSCSNRHIPVIPNYLYKVDMQSLTLDIEDADSRDDSEYVSDCQHLDAYVSLSDDEIYMDAEYECFLENSDYLYSAEVEIFFFDYQCIDEEEK